MRIKRLIKPFALWLWRNERDYWAAQCECKSPWMLAADRMDAAAAMHRAMRKIDMWEAV